MTERMTLEEALAQSGHKPPRDDPESREQIALFQWLGLNKAKYPAFGLPFAIPNGAHRSPKVAARSKAEGQKAGVWDIFVPVTSGSDADSYCGMWIEMKVGENKLTQKQEEFRKAHSEHYKFVVCYEWAAAAAQIADWYGIVMPSFSLSSDV